MALLMATHYSKSRSQIVNGIRHNECGRWRVEREWERGSGGWVCSGCVVLVHWACQNSFAVNELPLCAACLTACPDCGFWPRCKRIIYKSLTFKNCQLQGKCLRFDVQFMKLTLKCCTAQARQSMPCAPSPLLPLVLPASSWFLLADYARC